MGAGLSIHGYGIIPSPCKKYSDPIPVPTPMGLLPYPWDSRRIAPSPRESCKDCACLGLKISHWAPEKHVDHFFQRQESFFGYFLVMGCVMVVKYRLSMVFKVFYVMAGFGLLMPHQTDSTRL